MVFSKSTLLSAVLLIVGIVGAVPTVEPNEYGLVPTNTVNLDSGAILTVWGEAPGYKKPRDTSDRLVARACFTGSPICSTNVAPSAGSCNQLIQSLTQNSGNILGDAPRSICLSQNGVQCCISWADVVENVTEGILLASAQTVQNQCVINRASSGLQRNVNLNGICTTQCLSNRPGGCTDS
jgi:hypothetical protein